MEKAKLFLLSLLMSTASTVFAQMKTVKGNVIDDKGEPVIGAVIKAENGKTVAVLAFTG